MAELMQFLKSVQNNLYGGEKMAKEQPNKIENKPVPVKKGKIFGDPEAYIEW
jgi:hypothetical protein